LLTIYSSNIGFSFAGPTLSLKISLLFTVICCRLLKNGFLIFLQSRSQAISQISAAPASMVVRGISVYSEKLMLSIPITEKSSGIL